VAILSRGYRGTETGSGAIISTPEKIVGTIEAGGEEPYWLAEHLPGVPVLVGKNRFRSGLIAGERFQSELIILDDGFQHLGLARRVNLLLLAAPHLFGNGRLLPAGTLREPAEEIRRANLVLITHAERMAEAGRPDLVSAVRALHPIVPLFFSGHEPWKLWDFPGRCPGPLAGLRDKPVLAFCGLAQPDSFRFSLESLGARVVRMVPFRDHHAYRPEDLERLARLAVSLRVEAVVTTEKDILKIGDWPTQAPPLQVLAVRAAIPDPAFWTCLEEILQRDPAQEGQG
jgi:tetraacyldisaccharide 4'-kinase